MVDFYILDLMPISRILYPAGSGTIVIYLGQMLPFTSSGTSH